MRNVLLQRNPRHAAAAEAVFFQRERSDLLAKRNEDAQVSFRVSSLPTTPRVIPLLL